MFNVCFKAWLCAAWVCAGVWGFPGRSCCAFVARTTPQGHPPVQDRVWARPYSCNARVRCLCFGGRWVPWWGRRYFAPLETVRTARAASSAPPAALPLWASLASPQESHTKSQLTARQRNHLPLLKLCCWMGCFPPQYILGTVEAGKKTLLKITT